MTKLAVAIMVDTLEQALSQAAIAAEYGADLVEYRIDTFIDDSDAIRELITQSPLSCIVTCRPEWEGGHYEGNEDDRFNVLQAVGDAGPLYMDVELAAYQKSIDRQEIICQLVDHPGQVTPTSTGLVLSSHDFQGRPMDLLQRVEGMAGATACRVIKIVWQARSLRDNLEAFELISDQHKPTIALCMGETGLPSRVLAKKFGALLTFAGLEDSSGTAPGQVGVRTMKSLYRWDAINAETRVYGVIGWPVGHSMSPAIHNAGFDAVDFNGVYLPMPIPPEYEHFKATVGTWLDFEPLHFRGASVTIPHKENLLRFVEEHGGEIEPLAASIGAANTLIVRDDGSLYATNTDQAAALDAVCHAMGIGREGLKDLRVGVIGAGGAARAIVAGFAGLGATVVVYNRTLEKAQKLADQFNGKPGKVVAAEMANLCKSCCQVYVNCTPVGMHPNEDACPIDQWPEGIGSDTVVFDTIYNPIETRLLKEAKAAGCKTVSGLDMFVGQGAAQFKAWTGEDAPLDIFRSIVIQKLGVRS